VRNKFMPASSGKAEQSQLHRRAFQFNLLSYSRYLAAQVTLLPRRLPFSALLALHSFSAV
jgi:hypothetical protein